MNMPLLKVKEYDGCKQIEKIEEEFNELMKASTGTAEELLEALDLITATFSLITHRFSLYQIQAALTRHAHKLITERGWETKGTIKIELEEEE